MLQSKDIGWLNGFKKQKKKTHQDPTICCLQETHFRPKDMYILKMKGWKTITHANRNKKETGIAILISDKIDFKIDYNNKERYYIMIKG